MSRNGSQQQRPLIAWALAVEPEVLLFDEPTSALAPTSIFNMVELVTEDYFDISPSL